MTEPCEAAKRKAQELFDSALHLPSATGVTILARYIQTVSDVAKEWRSTHARPLPNQAVYVDPIRRANAEAAIDNLILPEEPCAHETVFRYPPAKTLTCTKCGKSLKLVEAE